MIADSGLKAHPPLEQVADDTLVATTRVDRLRAAVAQAQDFMPSPRERVLILAGMMVGAVIISAGLVVSALPGARPDPGVAPLGLESGGTLECSALIAPETATMDGDIVCSRPAGDPTDYGKLIASRDPRLVIVSQTITPTEVRFEVAAAGAGVEVPGE